MTSVPASEDLIREMIKESDGMNFDKARSINQDLTFEYAKRYFSEREVAFEQENQRTLGLIESYGTGIQRMIEEYKMRTRPKLSVGPSSFVTELPNLNVLQEKIYTLHEESSEYKVMRLFDDKEEITRKDVENLFNCSSFPARKVLNSLLGKRKINVIGNARATKYVLNEDEKGTFYY